MDDSISAEPVAIVVLGCAVLANGQPGAAIERRVVRAAEAFHARASRDAEVRAGAPPPLVIASGGRRWHGLAEADVIARRLVTLGVPEQVIVRELCSLSTVENAAYSAEILREHGLRRAVVVTCDWHVPRALACFGWMGVAATALAATSGRVGSARTRARAASERVKQLLDHRAARDWTAP